MTEVQKKIHNLRSQLRKEGHKQGKSGSGADVNKWKFYDALCFLQAFIRSSSSVSVSNLSHDIVSTLLSVIFLDHSEKVTIIITHCVITIVLQAVSKFICTVYFITLHFFHLRILPADCSLMTVEILAELVTDSADISCVSIASLF